VREQPRLWLVGPTELERLALGQRCFGVVICRRPPEVRFSVPVEELELDTSPWTQHSDSASLATAIRDLSVLGHSRRKLKKFIEGSDVPARVFQAEPIRV
jgi:hypothetical protein